MNGMAVHIAVESQLIRGWALEGEVRFPVLVLIVGDDESFVFHVNRNAVASERIVDALKGHASGEIKDGAAPPAGVGEQRRAKLAIDGLLFHVPDAVEGRDGPAATVLIPGDAAGIGVHSEKPDTQDDLRGEGDAVGATSREKRRMCE